MVRTMAAFGIAQGEIARSVGIRSAKTLRRHFREELDRAETEAIARVAQNLYQMATSGKNVAAAIFWLKVRGGWREHASSFARFSEPPPFVVMPEKKAA
jgi:predicted acetyltransferase